MSARQGSATATPTVRVKAVVIPAKNYSGETLAEAIVNALNSTAPLFTNASFYGRYVASEGNIHFGFGNDCDFEGSYNRSEIAPLITNAGGTWTRTSGVGPAVGTVDSNDSNKFTHSGDRIVTFTAYSSVDGTATFTEVNTAGTVDYTFTYDSQLSVFTSPSVTWNWQPPTNFAWNGIYPASLAKL